MQRRGIAAILAAAATCLVIAATGAYGMYAILDEDAFVARAAGTLASDEVRQDLGDRFAMRVVEKHPELMRGQSAIEEVATGEVIPTQAFADGFRLAAAQWHHTLFTDANADASLRVAGSGAALQASLQRLSGWGDMSPLEDPSLLAVESGGSEGFLRSIAPPAKALALPLTIVSGLAGLALLALGVARAGSRRRGIWCAGVTVACAAGLLAVGVTAACDVVLNQFDTGFGDAVVREVWGAFLGDLRAWALAAGAAGLVVAAAAGGPRLSVRAVLSTPSAGGDRLARAGGLLAVAALAVTLPELVLHVGLVTLAAALVYVAAGELLRVLAPPNCPRRLVRAFAATGVLLALIAVVAVGPTTALAIPS
jgi:hypothetical protein